MPAKSSSQLQPRTVGYEWGGPVGALGLVFALPFLTISLNALCGKETCSVAGVTRLPQLIQETVVGALPDLPKALGIELAWLAVHAIFSILPIGPLVDGLPLRNGKTLQYRLNAIHAFILSHAIIFGLHFSKAINLAVLADMISSLMLGSIIISFVMSVVLYVASYRSSTVLTALGGNTGNVFYDFWIGRELNPRTGPLDWKMMCELRPGLIGWSILNWAFVMKSVELGNFMPNVALIALFESLYVLDGLLLEVGNLTMMDIVMDGFGFMLCCGDLLWVPFTYTLQTQYLAYHPVRLSPVYMVLCVLLVALGYWIFRGANTEKNRFRTNPNDPRVAHLRVMKTSKGKSLIISGFWGVCRHPNYVGDWLMTVAWSALTGTHALIPYFHPIYFGILLMHRQLRDEESMVAKYGEEDWNAFCSIVKYRLFPYVY